MKAILRSINNFSCKLKQSNNLKYNISPKIRSNKFKNISGNGNVVIEDALNKNLKDYKIYGNTYQNSTSGKNLFDYITPLARPTYNGITCTIEGDTIVFNGTSTANNTTFNFEQTLELKQNKTKIVAYYISGTVTNYCTLRTYDSSFQTNTPINMLLLDSNTNKIEVISSYTYTSIGVSFRFNENSVANNFKVKIMVTDSDDDTFEPYTGGQPSPNPDYPQEIVSCGDLITDSQDESYGKYKIPVNVRSRNLFDKDNANIINAFLYNNKCSIKEDYGDRTLILLAKPNTTYTVSRSVTTPTFRVAYTNNDLPTATSTRQDVNVEGQITDENASSITITTGNLVKYLLVCYGHTRDTNINESLASIQIEEGSIATNYQPYYNQTTNIYLDEPLRKTKDDTYVDYIDFINQKVYRQLGGTEISDYSSFGVNAIPARFIQYLTPAIENLKLNIRDGISFEESYFFCNYIRMFGGSTATSKIRINILHEYLGTTSSSKPSEAKQALINLMNGKTMIFVYPLETPTEEDIELPNINLIEGKNIITIGTEVQDVFEVEYYSKEIIDISNYKYNLRKVED